MTAQLGIILGILALVIGFCVWLSKGGGARVKAKMLERELKDVKEFDDRGEEWDNRGGLGGIVVHGLQRSGRELRTQLRLDK